MMPLTENLLLEKMGRKDFSEVKNISLSNMNLTALDSAALSKLINLESLDISKNQLKSVPSVHLPNLKVLNCEDNIISSVSFVAEFPTVEHLYLTGNPLSHADCYIAVDKLTHLKTLDGKPCKGLRNTIQKAEERLIVQVTNIWKEQYVSSLKYGMKELEITNLQKQFVRDVLHFPISHPEVPKKFWSYKVQAVAEDLFQKGIEKLNCLPPHSVNKTREKYEMEISHRQIDNCKIPVVLVEKLQIPHQSKTNAIMKEKYSSAKCSQKVNNVNDHVKNEKTAGSKLLPSKSLPLSDGAQFLLARKSYRDPSHRIKRTLPVHSNKQSCKERESCNNVSVEMPDNPAEIGSDENSSPIKRRKEIKEGSRREKNEQILDYDPHIFLRCHNPDEDMRNFCIPVWRAAFEPDITNSGKTTDIVATCGGNILCLIDCSTGYVLKRYKHNNSSESLYTLAWTIIPVNGNEEHKSTVLATAGHGKEIHLVHPSQLVCYHSFKAHNHLINCLLFHPSETTWLFSGSADKNIHIWDIGALSLPDYKTSSRKLMTLEPGFEVLQLLISDLHHYLFVAGDKGLLAWNLHEKTPKKVTRKPSITLEMPKTCRSKQCEIVDGLTLVSDDYVAVKVSQSGKIFLWSISKMLKERIQHQKPKYQILPFVTLNWSQCITHYIYLGSCKDSGLLVSGDDEGQLWLYDTKEHFPHSSGSPASPTAILPWPALNFEDDKQIMVKEKVVINSISLNWNGTYLVACTDGNLICIWKKI